MLTRRLVRALLYRLACEPQPVARDHLQQLFWPDVPESVARRNLTHHLTHLRQALPEPGLLQADLGRVWLAPDRFCCDALELKSARWPETWDVARLSELVGRYRGPFLEDFDLPGCPEFEHWCLVERIALERYYLACLERLVELYSGQGNIQLAIHYARLYLETDSLSESMHQQLIQLYAASGERHLALRQFDDCTSILGRELSLEPLPETLAIYQAVKFGRRPFFDRPKRSASPVPPELDVPIIGREQELNLLDGIFSQLYNQPARVVLIAGEPGIGKTRLLHEFARRHQGLAHLVYTCGYAGKHASPYQPVREIVRNILGLPAAPPRLNNSAALVARPFPEYIDPVWLAEISRLLPELNREYPCLPAPSILNPEYDHFRLLEAVCRLLLSYARNHGPVLLFLDDLHWMDPDTLAWLQHLGDYLRCGIHPVMILATYRNEADPVIQGLRQALLESGCMVEIRLDNLDQPAVTRLVRALLGWRSGDAILAQQLYHSTGGNPYFLIEQLHHLVDRECSDPG